ncbi:rhodanese-like domain-containing protein [Paenibacillus antarcticus]|uniref:Sulfurtransferase n=1 Tax=Paenibacillus antarcticus TaxID=253703 RepID=A0A168QWY2_9BACL|nr:rhodanese-like domain-containing protein [Paenibacillus antarcticus]OAB48312.1 sulfurtransferase [Paenibacillus antarcticus]
MSNTPVNELDVEEVQEMIAKGEKIDIIDVREDDEWESGHISQAKHIPLGTLTARHQELDANQVTIMVCRSGGRSARACEYLTEQGYKVINMSGGMLAWEGPVVFGK